MAVTEKLVIGIIISLIGLVFFFNNKNMGEGTFKFYRWFYTKKRLIIMFRIAGALLILGGLLIAFLK